MSLIGVSFSDLIVAVNLCTKIIELYRNETVEHVRLLRNEVAFIKDKVSRLDILIQESRDLLLLSELADLPPQDGREQLVGPEFIETLNECERFCDHHRGKKWTLAQKILKTQEVEEQSAKLRKKLRRHLQGVDMLTQLIQLELLKEIYTMSSEVEYVRRNSAGLLQQLSCTAPVVPCSISDIFHSAINTNPPAGFVDVEQLPLWETLGQACRLQRLSMRDLTELELELHPNPSAYRAEQYLNLLKAQWLVGVIQRSSSLQEKHPGRAYHRSLIALEGRIADRYLTLREWEPEDNNDVAFSLAALLDLPLSAFNIWPAPPPPPDVSHRRPGEVELFRFSRVKSGGFTEELVLFRSGPTSVRLVDSQIPSNPYHGKRQSQRMIDTHVDRLIPTYALKLAEGTADWSIRLANSVGHDEPPCEFNNLCEALKFQMALTGYSVELIQAASIPMSFGKRRRVGVTPQDALGCLQIWVPTARASDSTASGANLVSYQDYTYGEKTITMPKVSHPPALVAFTVDGKTDTCSIWFIELSPHIVLTQYPKLDERCYMLLVGGTDSTVACRRMTVSRTQEQDLNLALFGLPRHPNFHNPNVVTQLDCSYIAFGFETPELMEKTKASLDRVLRRRSNSTSPTQSRRASGDSVTLSLKSIARSFTLPSRADTEATLVVTPISPSPKKPTAPNLSEPEEKKKKNKKK
ncbi:hypothetical protein BJX62DRAFT_240872 [Aspergillus germanicus]